MQYSSCYLKDSSGSPSPVRWRLMALPLALQGIAPSLAYLVGILSNPLISAMSLRSACLALATLVGTSVAAQQPPSTDAPNARLTVRPHSMATGTRTAKGGLTELPGFPGYYLYVPPQCVGMRRVPLIVLLHGGQRSGSMEIHKFSALADKYGMIVLAPNAATPGVWDVIAGLHNGQTDTVHTTAGIHVRRFPDVDVRRIDSAMKYVLHTNAIDPDGIALLGFSYGGAYTLFLGRSNQDIFSRVVGLSASYPFDGNGPQIPHTQFLISGGIAERLVPRTLALARELRREGHQLVILLGLRPHIDYVADEDWIWHWLQQSWADPGITPRLIVSADSDSLLTGDVMRRMTTFWTRFQQEPDSIRDSARMAHQRRIPLMLASEPVSIMTPVSVMTMDIAAMAAAFPSVAADLQAAGLTAAQEDAYRNALLRVGFVRMSGLADHSIVDRLDDPHLGSPLPSPPISEASALGKNLAFRKSHEAEFSALAKTAMWTTQ